MPYVIEKHPTLPALIATWHHDFKYSRDARAYVADMHEWLERQETPVYYVLDLRNWYDMTFDELVLAAHMATRSESSNFHHPMNLGNLVITNDPAVKSSVEGLRSDIFGNAKTFIFSELEDALNFIKKEL
jgi:hypothetical protein